MLWIYFLFHCLPMSCLIAANPKDEVIVSWSDEPLPMILIVAQVLLTIY